MQSKAELLEGAGLVQLDAVHGDSTLLCLPRIDSPTLVLDHFGEKLNLSSSSSRDSAVRMITSTKSRLSGISPWDSA